MDNEIINRVSEGAKMWAVLIDPDKAILETLPELCTSINKRKCKLRIIYYHYDCSLQYQIMYLLINYYLL